MNVVNIHQPQKILVYGTLKFGQPAHDKIADDAGSNFLGSVRIPGVMIHLTAYPGLVQHNLLNISAEAYSVSWVAIQAMDRYEGSGYVRKSVNTRLGEAWVYYLLNPPILHDRTMCVANGKWSGGKIDRATYESLLLEDSIRCKPRLVFSSAVNDTMHSSTCCCKGCDPVGYKYEADTVNMNRRYPASPTPSQPIWTPKPPPPVVIVPPLFTPADIGPGLGEM